MGMKEPVAMRKMSEQLGKAPVNVVFTSKTLQNTYTIRSAIRN